MLIGNELSPEQVGHYKSLCEATGGGFFHEDGIAKNSTGQEFVNLLLCTDGRRDQLATVQKGVYQELLDTGSALKIDGFALTNVRAYCLPFFVKGVPVLVEQGPD